MRKDYLSIVLLLLLLIQCSSQQLGIRVVRHGDNQKDTVWFLTSLVEHLEWNDTDMSREHVAGMTAQFDSLCDGRIFVSRGKGFFDVSIDTDGTGIR